MHQRVAIDQRVAERRRGRHLKGSEVRAGQKAHRMRLLQPATRVHRLCLGRQPRQQIVVQRAGLAQPLEQGLARAELLQRLAVQWAIQQARPLARVATLDQVRIERDIRVCTRLAQQAQRTQHRVGFLATAQCRDPPGTQCTDPFALTQVILQHQHRQLFAQLIDEQLLATGRLHRVIQQAVLQQVRVGLAHVQAGDLGLDECKIQPCRQHCAAAAAQGDAACPEQPQVAHRQLGQVQRHLANAARRGKIPPTAAGAGNHLAVDQLDILQLGTGEARVPGMHRRLPLGPGVLRHAGQVMQERLPATALLRPRQAHQHLGVLQARRLVSVAQPRRQQPAQAGQGLALAHIAHLHQRGGFVQARDQRLHRVDLRIERCGGDGIDQAQLLFEQQPRLGLENRQFGLVQVELEGARSLRAPAPGQCLQQCLARIEAIQPTRQGVEHHDSAQLAEHLALDQHRAGQFRVQPATGFGIQAQQRHAYIRAVAELRALRRPWIDADHRRRGQLQPVQHASPSGQFAGAGKTAFEVIGQPVPARGLARLGLAPVTAEHTLVFIEQQRPAFIEQGFDRVQVDIGGLRILGAALQGEVVQPAGQVEAGAFAIAPYQGIGQRIEPRALPRPPPDQGQGRWRRALDPAHLPLLRAHLRSHGVQRGPGDHLAADGAAQRSVCGQLPEKRICCIHDATSL